MNSAHSPHEAWELGLNAPPAGSKERRRSRKERGRQGWGLSVGEPLLCPGFVFSISGMVLASPCLEVDEFSSHFC